MDTQQSNPETQRVYTPGPWDKDPTTSTIRAPDGYGVAAIGCTSPGRHEEDEANAHLIAAAPDLFVAAYRCTCDDPQPYMEDFDVRGEACAQCKRYIHPDWPTDDGSNPGVAEVRAALAKAEGRI